MKVHANAALGPAGRLALCQAIESGMTLRAAAAALNVAPATAHRWWHRRRAASAEELAHGSWLRDRSSRPHRQPSRLSAAEEEPILRARRETGLGPGRLAGICRRARSTIWKVLYRQGLSRRRRQAPARAIAATSGRGQGPCFTSTPRSWRALSAPVTAVHRTVDRESARSALAIGYGLPARACVDDHSRYAYVEAAPRPAAPRPRPRFMRAGARALQRPRAASRPRR